MHEKRDQKEADQESRFNRNSSENLTSHLSEDLS